MRRSQDATDAGETLETLLKRYRRRPSLAVRNQIVERCRDVVEQLARSLALRLPPCVDPQDLTHAGMWGLIQAIERYEPSKCDQFIAYMRIRARGAMLDELRHMDFLPRLYRRRLRDREAALARLRAALARDPSEAEIAVELGIDVEQLRKLGDAPVVQSLAVGTAVDADDRSRDEMERLTDHGTESPVDALSRQELLAQIRASLRPEEWRVLQLHYLEGMSGKEVARRMRLSASRICQIHVRVLDRLKTRLAAQVG